MLDAESALILLDFPCLLQDMLQLKNKADELAIRRDLATSTMEINARMAEEKRIKALAVRASHCFWACVDWPSPQCGWNIKLHGMNVELL